jgi:hypothetical protein
LIGEKTSDIKLQKTNITERTTVNFSLAVLIDLIYTKSKVQTTVPKTVSVKNLETLNGSYEKNGEKERIIVGIENSVILLKAVLEFMSQ